jgi:hypothetical protein
MLIKKVYFTKPVIVGHACIRNTEKIKHLPLYLILLRQMSEQRINTREDATLLIATPFVS